MTRILAVSLLCCGTALAAQSDDLFVNDPRPMAAMAEKIERQTGWTITSEDPSYQYAADIEDLTDEIARNRTSNKRVLGMRILPFVFTLDGEARKDAVRAVRALAEHFEMRTGGQKFRVIAEKGFIHLVPQVNRDAQGVLVEQRPALDTRISLPAGKRTLLADFISEFTQVLSQESGRRIDVGTVPLNLMMNTEVELPAFKNTQARAILREALSRSGLKLSWQLFGGPGDENQVLNVHPVGARRLGETEP